MAISLGLGSTYCGTSKKPSRNSAPPIRTTATATIASTSAIDLMPGPEEKADRLVMPTSSLAPGLDLYSGIASASLTMSSLGCRLDRVGGLLRKAALLVADDLELDGVGEVEDLLGRHNLE